MAIEESAVGPEAEVAPARVRLRRNWARRLLDELLALLRVAAACCWRSGWCCSTPRRGTASSSTASAKIETASGLRIHIGRIDGSIFGMSRLKNVRVADSRGVFLTSPEILLDWSPGAWLYNSLHIDRLEARRVTLSRLPKLKPSETQGPAAARVRHPYRIAQDRSAGIAEGRDRGAARRPGAGVGRNPRRAGDDRPCRRLGGQWRPDGAQARRRARPRPVRPGRARLRAPANGLVPALFGSRRPVDLVIDGQGSWTRWRGSAALDMSGRPAARLALGADKGRYRLAGTLAPGQFLKGKLARLTSPQVRVEWRGDA